MNLIRVTDCSRADDELSWNNFYFIAVKEVLYGKNIGGFLENLTDYFLDIIVPTSLVIWNLNITEHYPEILLQLSLK